MSAGIHPAEKTPLRKKFEAGLAEWQIKRPQEYERLLGKLMHWGAAVGEDQPLWKTLEWQIRYLAGRKRGGTPEGVVDELFTAPTADEWMLRLQIP